MSDTATSPYLTGPYAPVADEITATELPVIGELPADLCGRYVRNGPNPIAPDQLDPTTHHWFVGDGMVHGLRLDHGRVDWYRNRYVGSTAIAEHRGEPDIEGRNWNGSTLGPNTHVAGYAGRTWAMVEAGGVPVELTDELETVGRNDFDGTLPGAFSAHPKFDPATGELHAIAYAWAEWMDHVQYVVVGPDAKVRHTLDIPLAGMSMIHDMSLTPSWAVVYDQPCTVDIELAMQNRFPFRWNPDYGNRLGLVPRSGPDGFGANTDDIVWIDVPIGYVFHPLNAYDTVAADGTARLVLDLCMYDSIFDTDIIGPFGDSEPRLERWTVDPARRTCTVEVIDATPNEFPRHAGNRSGQPYQYGYTVAADVSNDAGWQTIKHDLHSGERRAFDHGPGRSAGEAVFVARPDATAEDDGWLMTFVTDVNANSTEFVVLDAAEFDQRGYVARVPLPQRVPFGFHGSWIGER